MNELARLYAAWTEWKRKGAESSAILATVIKIEGSAYRRPGARMLLLPGRGGVGVISGGCVERYLAEKAWLLTEERSAVRVQYDTRGDADAFFGFGAGCRGVIHILLERLDGSEAAMQMEFFEACRRERRRGLMATIVGMPGASSARVGDRLMLFPDATQRGTLVDSSLGRQLLKCMPDRATGLSPQLVNLPVDLGAVEVFLEAIRPPVRLLVFGAGPDAPPLVRMASEVGWDVSVIDTRSAFLSRERFPLADQLILAVPGAVLRDVRVEPEAAAIIMSHDFVQDLAVLEALIAEPPEYLGVLGPRDRTERLLRELSPRARERAAARLANLHAPVGLDIGAETPEEIALAILAEIQATFRGRSGGKLCEGVGHIHDRPTGGVNLAASPPSETRPQTELRSRS